MGRKKSHIALLVEDEPHIAADVADMLYSLGHDSLHASSQEEALELLSQGAPCPVCYVLTDLQIPARRNSVARPDAGHNLIKEIRDRYPVTDARGKHYFPIIVMSAHAREDKYIIEAYDKGGSDFILKPFSQNRMPFGDQIRATLARIGREHHEQCALLTQQASGIQIVGAAPNRSSIVDLVITGRVSGKRAAVQIDKKEILLANQSFFVLCALAAARVDGDEYVHKRDLGELGESGSKRIERLRRELKESGALPKGLDIIENDEFGGYRLCRTVEVSHIDWFALTCHWDARVKELASARTKR